MRGLLQRQRHRAEYLCDLRDRALPSSHVLRQRKDLLPKSQTGMGHMSEIVVVTAHEREELLYLCLEAIHKADEGIPIFVSWDRGAIDKFKTCEKFNAAVDGLHPHNSYGNSRNVISAMRRAVDAKYSFVHCIEDDVVIYPGYFEWARTRIVEGKYACALGRIPGDASSTWYESPCVSWNANRLRECLDIIPPGYLEATTREQMQKILDEYPPFKKSRFIYGSAEQDGYFLRCIEHFKWKTAFPDKSFATHGGWWGYNREMHQGPTGTFEERVAICRKNLNDREFRYRMFGKRITDSEMEGWNGT